MGRLGCRSWRLRRVIVVVRGRGGICELPVLRSLLLLCFYKGRGGPMEMGMEVLTLGRGFFGPGEMQKEFEEAAFALKPGEVSGIVDSQSGLHLIERFA